MMNENEQKPRIGEEGKNREKSGSGFGTLKFLGLVLLIYLFVWFLNPALFNASYTSFIVMANDLLPLLGLVIVILLVLNVAISDNFVVNYLGKQSGIRGWLIIVVAGIFASGPQYLWFQLLQDLKGKGMRTGYIAAFLYAKAIKLFLLPMMIYYFGWMFTIVLTAYMLIFSVVNGHIVEALSGG